MGRRGGSGDGRRKGREQIETAYALKRLIASGVRVFFYQEDRECTLDSANDTLRLFVTTYTGEMEREKARQRTRDALQRKAEHGQVTGGRTFGYDNVRGPGGVRYQVNEHQAAVVRKIFERCVQGYGRERIAKYLNTQRRPSPRWRPGTRS